VQISAKAVLVWIWSGLRIWTTTSKI